MGQQKVDLSDGSTVAVRHFGMTDDGRQSYAWEITLADGTVWHSGSSDMVNSGVGDEVNERSAMQSFASFVSAFSEAVNENSDNWTLFPDDMRDWAVENADELTALAEQRDRTMPELHNAPPCLDGKPHVWPEFSTTFEDVDGRAYVMCLTCRLLLDDIGPEGTDEYETCTYVGDQGRYGPGGMPMRVTALQRVS